jgi:hypothetical protein
MTKKIILTLAAIAISISAIRAEVYDNEALLATATAVSTSPAKLVGFCFNNLSSAPAYAHFYDAASAGAVTVGTTVQVYMVPIPQTGFQYFIPTGLIAHSFSSGMVIAITTSPLSTGSTAPSVGIYTHLDYSK